MWSKWDDSLSVFDKKNIFEKFSNPKNFEKLDHLTEEVGSISQRMVDIERSVEFTSSKISTMEKEIPKMRTALRDEILKFDKKITIMEIYNRKPNLLFYGVTEPQGEHILDTLKQVFICPGVDEEKARSMMLANAHRLPRRNPPENAGAVDRTPRPSPIIAKFINMADRDYVLSCFETQQRQRPRATADHAPPPFFRITVRTDLPPALKARRGILAQEAYKLRREKGLSTRIKVHGAKVILEWKEKGTKTWKLYQE